MPHAYPTLTKSSALILGSSVFTWPEAGDSLCCVMLVSNVCVETRRSLSGVDTCSSSLVLLVRVPVALIVEGGPGRRAFLSLRPTTSPLIKKI